MRIYHIDDTGLNQNETLTLCRINGISASVQGEMVVHNEIPPIFSHKDIRNLKSFENVVEATVDDSGNAIAYNLLLSGWTRIFGDTNTSMRMMSVLFGLLTVILGYYFCRQLFNERTANIAGLLLCFHPVLVEYGQFARAYVPATFFILLSTYSIYQVSVTKKHTWLHIPLYVLILNIALLFHYATLYVFISHILLVAIFHSHRKALVQYSVMAFIGFGLFSLWLLNGGWEGKKPINIERSMWQQNLPVNNEDPSLVLSASDALYDIGMNWVRIFGNDLEPVQKGNFAFLLMLALPGIALLFAFKKVRKSEYFRPVMFVTFPFVLYTIFVLLMVWRTGHNIPFDIGYSIFVIPFACLLMAFGFDRMLEHSPLAKSSAYILLSVVVAVMIAGFFPGLLRKGSSAEYNGFTYHGTVEFIELNASPSDTLIFQNKKDALMTNFYMYKKAEWTQKIDPTSAMNKVVIRNEQNKASYEFSPSRY
jgi:4-amino-4-deoxy-L-arabinose transferase-like glycosyltransferase